MRATPVKKIRLPKARNPMLNADGSFNSVYCAQMRIDVCERLGAEVDPEDRKIVKNGGRS